LGCRISISWLAPFNERQITIEFELLPIYEMAIWIEVVVN